MSDSPANIADSQRSLRNLIYWLIIVTVVGAVVGRISALQSRGRTNPMLSANDRSRWCTVRSLVEDGTYIIRKARDHQDKVNGVLRYTWDTIDRVEHLGPDGKQHPYSSKPPLFPTLLAGQYWLIKQVTGFSIVDDVYLVMRLMIVFTNIVPLLIYLLLIRHLVESHCRSDFARVFVLAVAGWGTLLTTFAITINNHLPAAFSVAVVMMCLLRIWHQPQETPWWVFSAAGLFAAFAAANELPALSFFGLSGLICLWKNPRQTLIAGVAPALLVVFGFFYTNYLAHNSWRPPYAHRDLGPHIADVEYFPLGKGKASPALRDLIANAGVAIGQEAHFHLSPTGQWEVSDEEQLAERFAVVADEAAGKVSFYKWDNWYDYPDSYWTGERTGVDAGEQSRATYLFHCLIGHHGIVSLTPIWLLSVLGFVLVWQSADHQKLRCLVGVGGIITLIVLAFYILRPTIDRNYGGVSSGLRWTFWLIPLWLVMLIPAVDRWWQKRWFQIISLLLLGISVVTVLYPMNNPWTQPWLYDLLSYVGWIKYS